MAVGIVTGTEIETEIVTMTVKDGETDHVSDAVVIVEIEEALGKNEVVAEREETEIRRTENMREVYRMSTLLNAEKSLTVGCMSSVQTICGPLGLDFFQ